MGHNPNRRRIVKKKKGMSRYKKISYALLIGIAVISFWRGIWGLSDLYLFPSNKTISLSISVIIGLVILIFTRKAIRELM